MKTIRVAFDVKGTLEGAYQDKVRDLFKAFEKLGCKLTVWSNMPAYAHDIIQELGLKADWMGKKMLSDMIDSIEGPFDIAIEDDPSQTWLAAKDIVLVRDLPIPSQIPGFALQLCRKIDPNSSYGS